MLYSQFSQLDQAQFSYGEKCSMVRSFVDIQGPEAVFACQDDTQLVDARITVRGTGQLTIGTGCELRGTIIVESGCSIVIGDGLVCNDACKIHASDASAIRIGHDCLFANVVIYSSDMHGIYAIDSGERINPSANVIIENRVWLARDTVVLKGSYISCDSVVGAGAIVSGKFTDANVLLGGTPARLLRDGIRWDRSQAIQHKLQLPRDFSAARFRSRAQRFDHAYVLQHGIPILGMYANANAYNLYLFYYTARALFEVYFKTSSDATPAAEKCPIDLGMLHDVLEYCYLISCRQNTPCGAYLLAVKVRLDRSDALALHAELCASTPHAAARIRALIGPEAELLIQRTDLTIQ